ncbi:hypothetical protein GCM10018785_65700 [Streptomyces longispororuber]|uniref:Uncharacterized protein n=1 Tax=Streptomyces longispororuber TaxID=68230 RepID=A0A919DXR8_9ACTN|nr:hypothetical protein [Streptomyces longispororuber]GHE89465.1 hypothetical protein GCM10018785_65700 [Streptomyces longispororuber]
MTVFPQDRAAAPAVEQATDTWEALRGACTRMVPHWAVPAGPAVAPVPPSRIHGVTVPAASARLLDGMSEYGD